MYGLLVQRYKHKIGTDSNFTFILQNFSILTDTHRLGLSTRRECFVQESPFQLNFIIIILIWFMQIIFIYYYWHMRKYLCATFFYRVSHGTLIYKLQEVPVILRAWSKLFQIINYYTN
ncbi:hypothetical protein ACJX0J_006345 [Zea mays]